MLGRFTVLPSDDGSNRFGVWDGAVNGWRATGIDDEEKAREVASDLDVQYDAPQPVQRATWSMGDLDVWIRDNGEWLGRVRDKDGHITWVPGTELRPT
jgi:hypothetical protein